MSNCPIITPVSGECNESFSGLGSTIYIRPVQEDGSLPKMEDMIVLEMPTEPASLESEETSDRSAWNSEGLSLSFTVEVSPEDRKRTQSIFARLFGTAGLTRKRIVRERKAYNAFRRRIKNPKRRLIPLYKTSQHIGMLNLMRGILLKIAMRR